MAAAFKLTVPEALALIASIQEHVGYAGTVAALVEALGVEKAAALIRRQEGVKLTKADNLAIIKAVYQRFPGDTARDKLELALKEAREAFPKAARFKEALAYVMAKVDEFIENGVLSTPSAVLPEIRQGRTLAAYGRVNYALTDLDTLESDLKACRDNNVRGYHFELFAWAGAVPDTPEERTQMEECYEYGVNFCRENGMYWIVSGFNDNLGKGAYGDPGKPLSDYPNEIEWAINLVKKHGPANVIFQPVSECGRTAYGHTLEQRLAKEMSALGFYLLYNHGSRPSSWPAPYKAASWHINKISDKPAAKLWVCSDTGTAIQQLCYGLEGRGKPDTAFAWASQCAAIGNPFVMFYHFKWKGPTDIDTIKALGRAVPQAEVDDPVPSVPEGDIDLSQARWIGAPNGAGAVVTETLTNLRIEGEYFHYTLSPGTEKWEPHRGDKNTNQCACFFVFRNGRYEGGRFDDSTYSRKSRELKNIRGKYTGGIVPLSGEWVWVCFTDVNGKHRTNCQKVRWP